MENFQKIFEEVYQKYNDKDYFSIKSIIRSKLNYAKEFNKNIGKKQIIIKYTDIKKYLKNEKLKVYNIILKRLE